MEGRGRASGGDPPRFPIPRGSQIAKSKICLPLNNRNSLFVNLRFPHPRLSNRDFKPLNTPVDFSGHSLCRQKLTRTHRFSVPPASGWGCRFRRG